MTLSGKSVSLSFSDHGRGQGRHVSINLQQVPVSWKVVLYGGEAFPFLPGFKKAFETNEYRDHLSGMENWSKSVQGNRSILAGIVC
jgi:hypothetical protein